MCNYSMSKIKKVNQKNELVISNYINDYTLETDLGSYTPNEYEQTLITDAIYGLLDDEDFSKTFIEWKRLVKEKEDMSFIQSN